MERLLDELAFEAPELGERTIAINGAYVRERLQGILKDEDLSQYVL
jgi:ATP-dependent HslUV protease ATP-binding subunit HslU